MLDQQDFITTVVYKNLRVTRIRLSLLLGFILFITHLSIEPLYTPTAITLPAYLVRLPRICAHKSIISNRYRGNTLQAIQEAMASHIEAIEVDLRLSKDDIPFLYHGEVLEEFTTGYGKPEDYDWAYLAQLTYKGTYPSSILSFEDLLTLVGSQKFIFADIKTDKLFNSRFASAIAGLIYKYHLQETCVVESFNPFFLVSMRLIARDILVMYDFTIDATAIGEASQCQFDNIPWLLKQPFFQKQVRRVVRPDILGPRFNLTHQLLQSLVDRGYPIIAWTVDDFKTVDALLKMGIHGVQTNKPLELFDALSRTNQLVCDAGGTSSRVSEIVYVKHIQDVLNAIAKAKAEKKSITIAGCRHSMGGQTILNDSIHLNIMGLDDVCYNPERCTVTVGAGATWEKVQTILDRHNRSIKVMQSDNIFTVGGSISVNVHGWQVNAPPIASTIRSLKVVGAHGVVRQVSRDQHKTLFGLVIGGYGLFGVIIEVELYTVANTNLSFQSVYMPAKAFTKTFQQYVTNNPNVELAYGRLSVDTSKLLEACGLFWYHKKRSSKIEVMKPESFIWLKRSIFRFSQYTQFGKKLRWLAEKIYAKYTSSLRTISRNNAMHTDIHILWPLYGKSKDVLHEYFVPKNALTKFLASLKKQLSDFDMNILNVTIREVRQDNISLLPYAKQDMFGLVCLFSQKQGLEDELKMQAFSNKIIDEVIKLNGTFYLPYKLYYSKQQILSAYPEILDWINLKKKWDPAGVFNSQFFQYINKLVA